MKKIISEILANKTKVAKEEIEKLLEVPPISEYGDYAIPCFVFSRTLKKNPVEIALELSRELNKKLPNEIEKTASKGPYLNFFINKKILIKEVLSKATAPEFGTAKENEKILLEHTSVNPNASPHVGRSRNSIIGDSIARILTFRGNKVERHYYVNDVSKQIAMLALIFKPKDKFENMLDNYVKISKQVSEKPELEKKVFDLLEKFESKDPETTKLFNKIVKTCIDGQKKIFSKFGIEFDYFDYESKYIGKTSQDLLKRFEETGKLFQDEDGRKVLDQSQTHLIRKMKAPYFVLARSNGTGLYGLRDIAYTMEKMKHGKNILILGEDQKLYFEQVSEALKLLNYPSPDVVHYSFVLIQTDKGASKMSTRRGELVLLESFFEEAIKKAQEKINSSEKKSKKENAKKIAIGAIKYAMLRNDNDKNIIFSWEQSLNFEGDSGPYLQYSYARASSIIKKSKSKSKSEIPEKLEEKEIELAKKIAEFPEVVEKARKNLSPSIIANYSFQLAQTFNEFYHSCPVVGNENEAFRIKLIQAFRNTIKNSLYLLGIEVMDEM